MPQCPSFPHAAIIVKAMVLSLAFLGCSATPPSPLKEVAAIQQLREDFGEIDSDFEREYLAQLVARLTASGLAKQIHPSIVLLNNTQSMAGSFASGAIVISRGLIQNLKSEGELAFVIAHEMGHLALGHRGERPSEHVAADELAADRFGLALLARANYDPRVSISSLLHAAPAELFWISTESYPSVQERTQLLQRMLAASGWLPPGSINSRNFDRLQTRLKLLN